MGSPLLPILSDFSLDSVIDAAVEGLLFDLPIIRKYVDDLFLAIPQDKLDVVLDEFNKHHQRLQFTLEQEVNNKLPFLDMLLIRKPDQSQATEWYAKPIASGRMLNFKSFHQLRHKVDVVNNFIHRVIALSTNTPLNDMKQIINRQLQNNGYSKQLVSRMLQKYISTSATTNTTPNNVLPAVVTDLPGESTVSPTTRAPAEPVYRPMPYIHNLSERLTKLFAQENSTVRIATRQTSVGNLHSRLKDASAVLEKYNIVYKIHCNQCNKCYFGMSKNRLGTRLKG